MCPSSDTESTDGDDQHAHANTAGLLHRLFAATIQSTHEQETDSLAALKERIQQSISALLLDFNHRIDTTASDALLAEVGQLTSNVHRILKSTDVCGPCSLEDFQLILKPKDGSSMFDDSDMHQKLHVCMMSASQTLADHVHQTCMAAQPAAQKQSKRYVLDGMLERKIHPMAAPRVKFHDVQNALSEYIGSTVSGAKVPPPHELCFKA